MWRTNKAAIPPHIYNLSVALIHTWSYLSFIFSFPFFFSFFFFSLKLNLRGRLDLMFFHYFLLQFLTWYVPWARKRVREMHFKCKIISEKKKMFCCWLEEAKEQVCSSVLLCVCVCVLFVDGLVFCFFIVFPTFLLIPHTIHRFTYNFEKKISLFFWASFSFPLSFFVCVCGGGGLFTT